MPNENNNDVQADWLPPFDFLVQMRQFEERAAMAKRARLQAELETIARNLKESQDA